MTGVLIVTGGNRGKEDLPPFTPLWCYSLLDRRRVNLGFPEFGGKARHGMRRHDEEHRGKGVG